MAEQIEAFSAHAEYRKYPWEQFTNQSIWRVKQGVDFTCDCNSFISALRQKATRMGMKLRTSRPEEGVVEFQCYRE